MSTALGGAASCSSLHFVAKIRCVLHKKHAILSTSARRPNPLHVKAPNWHQYTLFECNEKRRKFCALFPFDGLAAAAAGNQHTHTRLTLRRVRRAGKLKIFSPKGSQ